MAIDGNWKVTVSAPTGPLATTLVVTSAGSTFTGTQSGEREAATVSSGRIEGDQISWSIAITQPMSLQLDFAGVLKDNQMSGNVRAGFMGSFPFTGVREA